MTERIHNFLRRRREDGLADGPCLVVDLDVVRDNYRAFAKALPDSRVFYAVKANPAPELLSLLVSLGSCFDTASVPEIELVLAAGATADRISYGNTIKKERDLRLWHVAAGPGRNVLLLGPLAVHPDHRNRGIATALMRRAIARAHFAGHDAILLVGDVTYYGRFGFSAALTGELRMPGQYEPHRLLALELRSSALAGARGAIATIGTAKPKPASSPTLIGAEGSKRRALIRRAA
jgi:predicted N-acetyltransferase YhbS